jgi:two-component system response regulator PilR (NtrC family)
VPALRERRGDLPALCNALLKRIARDSGMPVPQLSASVLASLASHPMRGNVRELENLLHLAVALTDGDELHLDFEPTEPDGLPANAPALLKGAPIAVPRHAPTDVAAGSMPRTALPSDLQAYLDKQERDILVRALQESGFNRTAAATRLGLSLRQIRYRIARLGITTPNGDDAAAADE